MSCNRNILLSIRSRYVEQMLQGKKTVELRKIFPLESVGAKVYVYVPTPVKKVIGYFVITSIQKLPIDVLWDISGDASAVPKDFFEEYFSEKKMGIAIHFEELVLLSKQKSLQELRSQIAFCPPQSFQYVGEALERVLMQ